MLYRLILPDWAKEESPHLPKVLEGDFGKDYVDTQNKLGYNCYILPNYPSLYDQNSLVNGSHIDTFNYVFADMDLKDRVYPDKQAFVDRLYATDCPEPSLVVDSGGGIHAYWQVSDLDAMSFLRLQRRICRHLRTDEAVSKIYQLMRCPNTYNTKIKGDPRMCETLGDSGVEYTCEELDKAFPSISQADEAYCQQHYDKTYNLDRANTSVDDKIPLKFTTLVRDNPEVKQIWAGGVDDRSKADFRLGHIMHAHGFTKAEAMSTLVNSAKALQRAPIHRIGYAENIVDKIWAFESLDPEIRDSLDLSSSVKDILSKSGSTLSGTRFPCHRYLDATEKGFRLGHVIGLVAGSGVGKTAMALNMFEGFVQNNPDYEHFFIPLEQPANEIAERWRTMCGDKVHLHDKVHVVSNYADDGSFRHLSFDDLRAYLVKFQKVTGKKVGCVVIDHIGALKKKGKDGENQDLMDICHQMKAFAIETNTLLVMQSQAPREKAGIGDLEINKDAAYGTVYFESYCDFLITIWQPLKRCYAEGAPSVTAFKFCKIRHKKKHLDEVQEDERYKLLFDPESERMRELTQEEETSFEYWNRTATNLRKQDRKTDVLTYSSVTWTKETA